MKRKITKFLASPIGSIVKVFLMLLLGKIYADFDANRDSFTITLSALKQYGVMALLSCIPMVMNALNPDYKGYGTKGIEPLKADKRI